MPELPEVETVVRDLRPLLVGRTLRSLDVSDANLRKPWNRQWNQLLIGRDVRALRRRGKWILIDLSCPQILVVHLGMTGQLTVVPATAERETHTHLVFDLSGDAEQLRFRDIRRFGSVTVFDDQRALDAFLAETLGPEPFELNLPIFRQSIQSSARCLKAILLDQHVVAGVGNIYADEALHRAKLHPAQKGTRTTDAQCLLIANAIVEVLTWAIESRGSTIRNYVGGSGLRGGYQERFGVYGRTGEPCLSCGTAIASERLAGRSSHYCPVCQPAPGD